MYIRTVVPNEIIMTTPLSLRIVFLDELLPVQTVLSLRRIWSMEQPLPSTLGTEDLHRKIPKPYGELGRPGRQGYILRQALGWDEKLYKLVQVLSFH